MNIEYHKWYSENLGHDMELKVYGHAGKPIVVFPTSGGSYYEYEDFKMIEAIKSFIDNGSVQVYAIASVDKEAWLNKTGKSPYEMSVKHNQFDNYFTNEFTPFIRNRTGYQKFMSTGCSMGAYHALNMLLKHPDIFDECVALSGQYDLQTLLECPGHMEDSIYHNSPIHYLPNQNDPWFIDQYRQSRIVICSGQGNWEEITLKETKDLEYTFKDKNIPVMIEIWGHDVAHDWPWWRIQMPYFLRMLGYNG